jgi:hypothetical protein
MMESSPVDGALRLASPGCFPVMLTAHAAQANHNGVGYS